MLLGWVALSASLSTAATLCLVSRRKALARRASAIWRTSSRPLDAAETEIRGSRDVLQHAIDVARDGMAIYDRDLRLIAWNRAYADMFQFPPDLLRVGAGLDTLVRVNAERGIYGAGEPDDFVASRLELLMQPTEGQRIYHAPFGRVLEMRSVRLHNGGLFFTYTDATAQAKSEEELEAENITLEQRVRERTEQLETVNVDLLRAKAEADDANFSKTRFLAAASHDLLQPLNAARLYATSLRERLRGDGAAETARLADNVDTSLEAVEDILGALLEITQLDAGATRTEMAAMDVDSLFRQLAVDFQPDALKRGLKLAFVTTSLAVVSDRRLLRRLLQNLVSNALKYTASGGVVVGARRVGRDAVRLDVVDTGSGIPKSKFLLVFREFERLQSAADETPGAGLGLSIVDRLSRVLGHSVTLASEIGRGSRFSVLIPRAAAGSALPVAPAVAAPRQRSLDGLVVAAIDNESHVLDGMEVLLRGWDCTVATGTGLVEVQKALDASGHVPHVIVADFHIGDLDGLGVITALRRRYGALPAVLITADRSAMVRVLASGSDVRVLHKPLKPAALRALLTQWHLLRGGSPG